jgi:predicted nucleic acid-binding protein
LYVSTIALQELWAGASAAATPYLERLFTLARTRGRVINPPGVAWILAGQVLAVLARTHGLGSARLRGLRNDVLLAATAMVHGATILTHNTADFALIARVIPVRYRTPRNR